ncbi:sialyltransferase [Methanobrevibacter sp. 87.7]|uniref:sialyltransferase n=1 Tax=Methanobrevibacter sp. 87.7 TaxID=387957 RepID=UPI000B50D6C4|nr:sialyltransferase [Methanobrevibacter sp. 87.7]OWT33583.1 sialyltransferase [Methanobrevibacter sp. 87.7]
MHTVKDIGDNFFKIEEKYNLNHRNIQGVYFWQIIRMYLYYDITKKLNTFESPQQKSLSIVDKIKTFLPFIKNSLLSNPLSKNYHKDILIFDHPRKVLYNNKYIDIYSYFLQDYIKEDNKSYEIIESPYLNKHYTEKSDNIKYNDRILLGSYFYKKTNKLNFTDNELDLIENLESEIKEVYNININLKQIIENHILNFKYDYNEYKKLLIKRKPKQVYLVVAYENKALVAACHDLDIPVYELQHGTISKYHMGYSYPNEKVLDNRIIKYFPDKLLSFGEYWKDSCNYPIKKENIQAIGFSYFEENSKKFKKIAKKDNQFLFISQGVIGKYLSKFAFELLKIINNENKDFKIIYKLHPGEYSNWKENYPELVNAIKSDKFIVIDNSKTPLYKLFAESKYQVGAFSTGIYEGLQFDCITYIVNLPGIEYLDTLIEKNIVKKVDSPKDLFDNINFKPNDYNKNYFFKSFDKELFNKILNS